MVNRWENRTEPRPGSGILYWHILLGDQPQVQALTSKARNKLTKFTGLHFTPERWLHITTLVVGPAENLTPDQIADMTDHARGLLVNLPSTKITLRKILYHSEAITIKVEPAGALDPIRESVRCATHNATGITTLAQRQPWVPHITLAYSTTTQSASPIIAALGDTFPACEANIDSIALIDQRGAERLWSWHSLTTIPLATDTIHSRTPSSPGYS